jgi:2-polyprenyl-3-methyl-5-hydroxy-6-metoxy-1,4-benzoquinol methylase
LSKTATIYTDNTAAFEQQYIAVRKAENRLYKDDEVAQLPDIDSNHPHSREWAIRKKSCAALTKFLSKKNKPLTILEAGCGNGWLCHQLALIPQSTVTGIDVNTIELKQAASVFNNIKNLSFATAGLSNFASSIKYDAIIFAASIQYFPSLSEIINAALQQTAPGGEIHILDSPFYKNEVAAVAAEDRSLQHYQQLGYPEMVVYYFHHSISDLPQQNVTAQYNPQHWRNRLTRPHNPFPWFIITKRQL